MKKEELKENVRGYAQKFEDGGLRLLKKGQKGIVHAIFSRFGLVLVLLLLQVGLLFSIFRWFGNLLPHYFGGSVVVTAAMVVYLLNSKMDNSAKITWMVVVAILPVVGVPLFFYVKSNAGHNLLRKRLEALGIQCKVFSPVQPFVSTHYNYRDHRKILVIDGRVGFTGGVNLADEYINHVEKYGRWKDAAIMLEGEAVRSLTALFLEMWSVLKEPEFEAFLADPIPVPEHTQGTAAPYGDCPLDGERVGEMVYIDLLNRAREYIHIMTPYLILDGELETALKFAAERGVDVHLILPGIADKKFPNALAKTHYSALLDSGVKISEWTPGFVHAKVFVVDDREAVVGTINLDYRSLYHHFENAVWLTNAPCIRDIEEDFQATLEQCRTVENNPKSIWQGRFLFRAVGMLLKVIAPLL